MFRWTLPFQAATPGTATVPAQHIPNPSSGPVSSSARQPVACVLVSNHSQIFLHFHALHASSIEPSLSRSYPEPEPEPSSSPLPLLGLLPDLSRRPPHLLPCVLFSHRHPSSSIALLLLLFFFFFVPYDSLSTAASTSRNRRYLITAPNRPPSSAPPCSRPRKLGFSSSLAPCTSSLGPPTPVRPERSRALPRKRTTTCATLLRQRVLVLATAASFSRRAEKPVVPSERRAITPRFAGRSKLPPLLTRSTPPTPGSELRT